MGVTYYTCEFCSKTFDSYSDPRICLNCHRAWCEDCEDRNDTFYYGDTVYCNLCRSAEPKPIKTRHLLKLALEKLGTTADALHDELLRQPKFNRCRNEYTCTSTIPHGWCGKKECTHVLELESESELEDREAAYRRGVCCVASKKVKREDWCRACEEWNACDVNAKKKKKKMK